VLMSEWASIQMTPISGSGGVECETPRRARPASDRAQHSGFMPSFKRLDQVKVRVQVSRSR